MRKNISLKPGIPRWISGLLFWVLISTAAFGQQIGTVAGDGTFGFAGDGGAATSANIADPVGVFVDSLGNLYIADTNNRRIRKVDTSGVISTIAGNGSFGFAGDGGQATDASLADPTGVFVDAGGTVYIADTNNQRIRKIDASGVITTLAGDGNAGFSGDGGLATSARLNFPSGIFVDNSGNVFFADRENHRVRKVDGAGIITTVVGNGAFGSSGDGGAATSASLAFPSGVFGDQHGNLYVADRFNYKIRKIDGAGVITTIAGNGVFGFSGDGGPATSANLAFPSAVFVDSIGSVLIADRDNHRIRQVDTTGVITTIVGNGTPTFGGDGGSATDANLNRPSAVWANANGALWIADTNNRRIRKVAAPLFVSTPVSSSMGIVSVLPAQEQVVWQVGVTGDGTTTITQVHVTLSDLSNPTGLTTNDFASLRLYESVDAVFDGGDTQVATLVSVPVGSVATLVPESTLIPPSEAERFYFITAVLHSSAVDGHAFRVGFAAGGLLTASGGVGQAISADDANHFSVDVVATQLVFTSAPTGSVSGQSLTTQPVVVAQDASGYVDRDFGELVTLSLSQGAGQLTNAQVMAVNGIATFANVVYTASADNESVILQANDADGGGSNLPVVLANAFTSDVLATQLVFTTQPAGSVSGQNLTTQPVVVAQDGNGLIDTDFSDVITLSENGAGVLTGASVQAVGGVATFTQANYLAVNDKEAFTISANDEVGGAEGDLPTVQASALTSDVVATQIVFTTQPAGSISGQSLTTQPVVAAWDDSGRVDTDFSETIALTLSLGAGTLANNSVQAVNGVGTFPNLIYNASSDRESFGVVANDEDGVGSNLPTVSSSGITSNVVATQLSFLVEPAGVASGQAFTTQPVVVARDSMGVLDTDFSDTVTLTEDGAGTLSNNSVVALNGVATFTNVTYTAASDSETFTLSADDEVGGEEGDLPVVQAPQLSSDIVATQLVFSTQPLGSASGMALQTQPVVTAIDDSGRVDANFSEMVTLTLAQGNGRLHNNVVQAINGIATFESLVYVASGDGESFALSADDESGVGSDLQGGTSNILTSDVLATRLLFGTQPSGAVSGQLLQVQPIVVAQNDSGQVDTDFSELVSLTHTGNGVLTGETALAVQGTATFDAVQYTAVVDGESFALVADDVAGGAEGNLGAVQSLTLAADVIATELVFSQQPSGAVSGQVLTTQPTVTAIDDSGRVDTDFSDIVTLSASTGALSNHTMQATNGVAAFDSLRYTATLDKQSFTLQANDAAGGLEGDLPSVSANPVVSEVVAVKLLYLVQPSGSVSGQAFTVQPLVVGVDANDMIDVDFNELVTLSIDGVGTLQNATQTAVSGIATFSQVTYQSGGGESTFRLVASGPNVTSVTSQPLSTQVIATQLVFAVQPAGSVSGQAFLVAPIVEARDSLGQVDKSFTETLTITVQGPGGVTGHQVVADSGRAVFTQLAYFATADQETFTLSVDDQTGGEEGDLPVATSVSLICDVVATRLVYVTPPSGSVSGTPLQVQPQLAAVDSVGIVDTGFAEGVRIEAVGDGSLLNQNATMQNGIATFVGLTYLASADGESFVLRADDAVGGLDLQAVESDNLVCDVVASRLVYLTQPSGAISGQPFEVQPKVAAVDSVGLVDVDFVEPVNFTTQSGGVLTNIVVPLEAGVGTATELTFVATQDQQSVVIVANDMVGGVDLALVQSDSFLCDVVATELSFETHPQGSVNGRALVVQPVVRAHYQGVLDVDFVDVVRLSSTGQGTLLASPVAASGGVATFTDVVYLVAHDKEAVKLVANDTDAGSELDLAPVESDVFVTEVQATRLQFRVMPSGIISGRPFLTQPTLAAVDSLGAIDVDFEEQVVLTTTGGGQLANASLVAVDGVAAFTNVNYTASTGLETFVITADDQSLNVDLLPAVSETLTAGAGPAHHLDIFVGPSDLIADGVSTLAVVVRVLDENDNPRIDDVTTRISLLVQGAATGGGSLVVDGGEAKFDVVSTPQTGTVYLQVSAENLLGDLDSIRTVAGEAKTLAISFDPTPLVADGVSQREVRLQLLDAQGNLRTQDNTTLVALGVTGASAGGGTKAVRNGEAIFDVTSGAQPGLIQLRANAAGLPESIAAIIVGAIMPNLTVVANPSGPEVISKGQTHTVALQIQNAGLDTVRSAFDVAVMLVGGADSIQVGNTIIQAPVAPDSTLDVTVSFSVPSFSFSALASDYHWVAVVDAGGFVSEHDEGDNLARGNAVGFPELSVSPTFLNFERVVPDSSFEKILLVENRGQASLQLQMTTTDSQLTFSPFINGDLVLGPGENRLFQVIFQPTQLGPFASQLIFDSNDPKGNVILDVTGAVAAPGRILLDLDSAEGNQGLRQLESGRDQVVDVELFLDQLPPLQALSVDIQFNTQLLNYEEDSWVLGGYFVGGANVSEVIQVDPRTVRLSGGSLGNQGVRADLPFGRFRFSTPATLPSNDTTFTAEIEAVQIRFLQEDGVRDSLLIQADALVTFQTKAVWPDLDGDGMVGFSDFLIFVGAFRQDETSPGWDEELPSKPFPFTPYRRFDIDKDGRIGFFDFVTYAQDFKLAQGQP